MIRVLIVEDDPMVAELNRGYINRMDGFKVVGIKADGKEALEYISKKQVDLLVLDVNVQKINGLEVLIQIRKSQKDIDVIFITASREKGVVGKAVKLGVIDYLTQGSNPSLLPCRWTLYQLSHQGNPRILEWVAFPFSRGFSQLRDRIQVSCIAGSFFTS